MLSIDLSPQQCGKRVLALALMVFLVGALFASAVAAQAAIGIPEAGVSATEATVGENVTVNARVVNVGDGGGGDTLSFQVQGTTAGQTWANFETKRVTLDVNEERIVNATIQLDQPGTYALRVGTKRAGEVTVTSSRARVASATASQRRIDIRANGVSTTEPTGFNISTSNRSVALQRWSPITGQSGYQQYLSEYTNRSETSVSLPSKADSTLFSVIDFESEDGFQESTLRVGITDSVLANATLDREAVTVYQRNGTGWEPLSTSVATSGSDRTIYEATATQGTTYAVGRIQPNISLVETSYNSAQGTDGIRLNVEGSLQNTSPISDTYASSLRVNGDKVSQTTVTVPANGKANVSMFYNVTEPGEYSFALNQTTVGSVLVTSGQIEDSQSGDSQSDDTSTGVSVGDTADGVIPSTVLGVNTLALGAGLIIALLTFVVVLLLLLRRGGDGGGGGQPESFDPW